MNRTFIYLTILILCSSKFYSQTIDGQFITNVNPPTYAVTIAVNMQSGTGSAGILLIEFIYNTNDLSFSSSPIKGTDYILYGNFNTFPAQNILRPTENSVRIALSTFGNPAPVPLSTTPTNIITMYFTIVNQQGSSNLTWTKTEVSPGFPNPNYTKGNWPNLNESPLPVEFSAFTAKFKDNSKVDLNWITKTEVNNYGFNVERRINESEWNTLGFVKGHGNSNSPKQYSFTDKDLFAGGSKFHYRLKQIDNDGSFEYSDVIEVEILPTKFELSQNYPNPFNPSTTIRFSLPKETQLKINIYNMLGELVRTIAEGNYEAGYHKITVNAADLPSGAYIYRIESPEFVQVKKMVLIK
ncbi:MAG: T9SS type A sorting domain-containing protein [Ignavibacteriaceae bacterium]|nr:T9SS type A sorting domain-containing protein [Ignavibacteriaceae bacterium]